jgi:hypothetical protein
VLFFLGICLSVATSQANWSYLALPSGVRAIDNGWVLASS